MSAVEKFIVKEAGEEYEFYVASTDTPNVPDDEPGY